MTVGSGSGPAAVDQAGVGACCASLYGNPLAELLVGGSLHPGGLDATRELLAAGRVQPGERLLDAGCGAGASTRLAADAFGLVVDGVDLSGSSIARAEARGASGRVRWVQADLHRLPYDPATFDVVLAECVLSTTARMEVLRELHRVLRPGGRLLVSDVWVVGSPLPSLHEHGLIGAALCVTDAWREGELEAVLAATGFTLERNWDRSASILELVDRIEARVGLAATAARDLGIDLGELAASVGLDSLGQAGRGRARELAQEVREAVARGDLGYFGAIAVSTDRAVPS